MSNRGRTVVLLFLPAALTLVVLFGLVFFYVLPKQHENLLEQKREALSGVVDIALKNIQYEYELARDGRITPEQAQANALARAEFLRWGPNDENYCYVVKRDGTLLAHPYNPELVGSNLNDVREGDGRSLGRLLRAAAERPDWPYVTYKWNKPGETEKLLKLNRVRMFAPWGWMVGGGVYLDDIDALYREQQRRIIVLFGIVAAIISVLLGTMIRRGLTEGALRTRSERELLRSEQKFRDIYDNTAALMGLLDPEGRVLDVNRTAADFAGIPPDAANGQLLWDTPWWSHDPARQEELRAAFMVARKQKVMERLDTTHMDRDGNQLDIDLSIKPILDEAGEIRSFIVEGLDVTEQRLTEAKLRHSQKLDAIGHLAGGIAHDFNNMLCAILGSAELLARKAGESSPLRDYADMIISTAEKASELTRKLLTFSRKGKITSTPIDVHESLQEAIDILARTIDRSVQVVTELKAPMRTIVGDPVQIQNAIINLGVNASQAMPGGGTLSVTTSNHTLSPKECELLGDELTAGTYIRVDVCDTGHGIEPAHLERIFEPFFTTKDVGEGTGLGLAAVYGMVKDHQGAIQVESEVDRGTCFRIYLPTTDAEVERDNGDTFEELHGTGSVLVIDDEPVIRITATNMLNRLGYDVLLAEDGQAGVDVYRQNRDRIDVVVLDMVMPRMSGSDCLRRLREINPDVRVILCSGFAREARLDEHWRDGVVAFIEKPYRLQKLATAVRGALQR